MRGLFVLAGLAWSCSSGPAAVVDAGICPKAPENCPADAPSYSNEVAPILKQSCTPCHRQGGSAGFSETTYLQVRQQASAMLSQVNGCVMPPNTYPLTSEQRETLLAWLVCGAPDN